MMLWERAYWALRKERYWNWGIGSVFGLIGIVVVGQATSGWATAVGVVFMMMGDNIARGR